ncbi:PEFG-CTERM sorting domain-containing protein [Nitrosopumilus zosterae]|uniref:PEFG-CTERM sorting domain-containing protein n=1 Tax=Nitrosopumilus zosterae TaxID=718286 RepID=UPI000D6F3D2F|nr:PEFG-CTERM sorting domain-containing protein [Nitrosopumilus zosterae]BDQ30476.1 PEFG-CTERM sorting domain-containing protein [Nitrosopumilus zosterae]
MIRLAFLLLLIVPTNYAFAEHIFNPEAYAQYLDISQLESEKITFDFDGKSYDIYYGFHGSLDAMGSDDPLPTLHSMNINEERKSIEIIMEDVPEKTDFWIRTPQDVLYAEGEKFTVLVDGVDTGYDLMKFPNDYVVGFILSENTTHIEVIGTRVIPEFGGLAILILAISVTGIIYVIRKNPVLNGWTRIN